MCGALVLALVKRKILSRDDSVSLLENAIEHADGTTANVHEGQLVGFTLAIGLPSWRYQIDGLTLEKSMLTPARHTTCTLVFARSAPSAPSPFVTSHSRRASSTGFSSRPTRIT